jgi:MHS family proline/betaine transporter-like MFS transporter
MDAAVSRGSEGAGLRESAALGLRRRSLAATTIGNFLEWYDFIIYAYFATTIATKFFPSSDAVASLLSTFAVFGIGFVMRPVGGIVIGRFADRAGRKPALLLTVFLMAGGSVMIGVLPGFATIGLAAPLLLTLARLIQGFSAGGEWGSAATFVIEWAPARRRGFLTGMLNLTTFVGVLLGSGAAALLSSALPKEVVDEWAWRIPFLAGGLLGIVGLYMRRSVDETPVFKEQVAPDTTLPLQVWGLVLRIFALSAITQATFYICFGYFPTFVQTYAKIGRSDALWSNTLALLVLIVLAPLVGWLSDTVRQRRTFLIIAAALTLIVPYFMVRFVLAEPTFTNLLIAQLVFAAIYALPCGVIQACFAEALPTRWRLFVIATAYNLAGVVFAAFAPYLSIWLIQATGTPLAVCSLLVVAAITTGLGTIGLKERAGEAL